MIWRDDTEYPIIHSSDMVVDNSKELNTIAFQADMIQSISVTGQFQVSTDSAVNQNTVTYHYFVAGLE